MGSDSDWRVMSDASQALTDFGIAHEVEVVSAHRTPDKLLSYGRTARARGLRAIIAGAGGAAHLPGMAASMTSLPVLGVPVESKALSGQDSLLSIVQMPAGIPVGTLAIGKAGAVNAALLAAAVLALSGIQLWHFWTALILLGLGWNFGFIGATAIVASSYRPHEADKVQGFHDIILFGAVAVASFSSGKVFNAYGWQTINLMFWPIAGISLVLVLLLLFRNRRAAV